jgi:hypothetical protein
MPVPPPVTTATFPAKLFMTFPSPVVVEGAVYRGGMS